MTPLETLDHALEELRRVIVGIADDELDAPTNCEPWTVRRLASHALNNQLLWGGVVSGAPVVRVEDAMGAVPIEGDLGPVADDVVAQTQAMWRGDGVLETIHATPLGELPGAVITNFAVVDAIAHAWDLSASLGRAIEFDAAALPAITAVFAATCTDAARDHGLIKSPTEVPADANATERLMASAGRTIPR